MTRVHFVGIGGAGLSALARVMMARGWTVSGSDRERSIRTDALAAAGAAVHVGHDGAWVEGADVVVISSAIPADNPEIAAARAAGIPVMKRDGWLAEITRNQELVAVAGTHGKSTTTAMVALMMVEAGLDPTVVIGAEVPQLGGNARAGRGRLFVVEADEYDRAFLGLRPTVAAVLNVEHDHPDIFPDEAAVRAAFGEFVARLRPGGTLIVGTDDPGVRALVATLQERAMQLVPFGLGPGEGWRAEGITPTEGGGSDFVAVRGGVPLGAFRLQLPGRHNILNALAAIAIGSTLGVDTATQQAVLGAFTGADRRFQTVGRVGGIEIVDDYAHHPTEIRATLEAARARFGDRPLWVVFQPHTFSRLDALREDFLGAFAGADHVIVSDVYAAREAGAAADTAAAIAAGIRGPVAEYLPDAATIVNALVTRLPAGAVVLTLGAGDITTLGPVLAAALDERRGGDDVGR